MTRDARRALARAGFSRRDFLRTSGALIVGFSSAAVAARSGLAQGPFGTQAGSVDPARLDSWIAIAADGTVTVYTGKLELGQGIMTAQAQLVAEELQVPLDRVRVVQGDTAVCPNQGTTSGSQSTPTNFNHGSLALAAATAREALARLGPGRPYAEVLAGRKFNVALDPNARRRPSSSWTVLGKPAPRVDMVDMATARFEFVHNVRVPGMVHGAAVRPPGVGATLLSVDESSVAGMPGLLKIVVKKNFVGVVAEKPWQAMQVAARLRATWQDGPALPEHRDLYDWLRKQPSRDAFVVNSNRLSDSRSIDDLIANGAQVVKATYVHPYQMHGSMGTSCAVADVQGDKATVWSPTQSAYPTRGGVAMMLGVPVDNVRVIFTRGSGCYGLNGADTVSYDAALLSQAVGKPVRVQLSRKDEMAWENYGFPYVIDQRVAFSGADGSIVAWDYEAWYASMGGRPGAGTPGNVVTGMLAGFSPAPFRPAPAGAPPAAFNNGSNAAPSYVRGGNGGTGTVSTERVLTHAVLSPFFTGPLRSPSRLQNTFAHECFLDEVAAHVKADPVAYRLRHLSDQRLKDVVSAAARAANWSARPSPRPNISRTGIAAGRGVSCVLYEGDNGYVAMVAEIEVDQATGRIIPKRFVVAQDCGPISNPDGMRNQIEGGALQGLSRALGEEVTWDAHQVTSVDWRSYLSLSLGFEPPVIESVLINKPDGEAMGAGETAITIVAAAIGNAIFDATGARVREVPFTPARVKAALDAR
jgi:nicotinate dehydrogenase subunit B